MLIIVKESFPDCLALVTEGSLLLGTVDNIQKLHIRTIPLGEQPRRIAHLDSHHVFAVLTTRQVATVPEDGNESAMEEGYIRLVDDTMMEVNCYCNGCFVQLTLLLDCPLLQVGTF